MKLDGQEADFDSGTLELETQDMDMVQRVLEAMDNRGAVMLDTTEYQPVSVDVQLKQVQVPDPIARRIKHTMRPVATITLRA